MPHGRKSSSVLELAGSHGHQCTRRIRSLKAAHAASSEQLELISADLSPGFTDNGWITRHSEQFRSRGAVPPSASLSNLPEPRLWTATSSYLGGRLEYPCWANPTLGTKIRLAVF